jgi:putative selenium metabolism hydrolase
MAAIVDALARLHSGLELRHPMLGTGSLAVTGISSRSPSLTAIPDECTIHVDRRLTIGESHEEAMAQMQSLPEVRGAEAEVRLLEYDLPSWRGHVYPAQKVFPAWETAEDAPAVQAALATARSVLGREPRIHRSAFSSNGCATAGIFDIPTVGFGPADEAHSHSIDDQISLAQLGPAMAFYALYPWSYLEASTSETRVT